MPLGARLAGQGFEVRPYDLDLARALVAGQRQAHWALDYPAAGDQRVAVPIAARGHHGGLHARYGPYVIDEGPGRLVGGVGFHGPPLEGRAEVGYGLAPSARGRGLARRALALLIAATRADGLVDVLEAHVEPGNLASIAVLEANGFEPAGLVEGLEAYELEL